jgi:hypothetical protein
LGVVILEALFGVVEIWDRGKGEQNSQCQSQLVKLKTH